MSFRAYLARHRSRVRVEPNDREWLPLTDAEETRFRDSLARCTTDEQFEALERIIAAFAECDDDELPVVEWRQPPHGHPLSRRRALTLHHHSVATWKGIGARHWLRASIKGSSTYPISLVGTSQIARACHRDNQSFCLLDPPSFR